MKKIAWILPLALIGCGPSAGGVDETAHDAEPMSWEAYKSSAHKVVSTKTYYVVEWDLRVSEAELRERYDDYVASFGTTRGEIGEIQQKSAVDRKNGADNIFHGPQMNLRYCVSNDFGSYKSRAVSEMGQATGTYEWLGARIHFVYVSSEDANCNYGNPNISLAIRPSDGPQDAPCASFPIPDSGGLCPPRTLEMNFPYIASPQWTNIWPNVTSVGTFKHELGHVLGLRHEHARFQSCSFEDSSTLRGLTDYDNQSVMHYPGVCGVPNNTDQNVTQLDITGLRRLYGDNGDKLLWHNSDGRSQLWYMKTGGTQQLMYNDFDSSLNYGDSTGWTPVGLADFNKDGKVDLVWHHTSGPTSIWFMDGVNFLGSGFLDGGFNITNGWKLVGLADFNKDGNTDFLLHHSGGANQVWFMDGATVVDFASLSTWLNYTDASGWKLEAVNDFNHDGNPDWFMRNLTTGMMQIWYMDGINSIGVGYFDAALAIPASSQWSLMGAHDFNRDGSPDLIWHHADGYAGYWYLEGTTVLSFVNVISSLNIPDSTNWRLVPR